MKIKNSDVYNTIISTPFILTLPAEELVEYVRVLTLFYMTNPDAENYDSEDLYDMLGDAFTALSPCPFQRGMADAVMDLLTNKFQPRFSISLTDMPEKKIAAIKWLRMFTTLGLKEAKEKVEEIEQYRYRSSLDDDNIRYERGVTLLENLTLDEKEKALKKALEMGIIDSLQVY